MILVEREQPLDVLGDLLASASAGRGRIALVRGEAGIGKTSLIRHFVDSLDDVNVLWGGCDDLLTARPLGPLWDMAYDEATLETSLRVDDRQMTFRVVLDLLSRSLRPTVMVIEDLHWADDATLDLIKYIGRRINRTHGLLLLSCRDTDVVGEHPLRVALGDLPYGVVERLPLQPLSREAVSEMSGGRVDAEILWELTRGNPFFVTEVIGAGAETVPHSIRDAVSARVHKLNPQARALVELASVAPGRIEMSILTAVMGEVADAIAECEEAGILELRGDSVTFRHELARRAVEGELPEIERRRLNRACLEAAERLGLDLARRAHHAREAGDPEAIVRILPEAARRACDVESHTEAVAHLRALEPYLDAMSASQLADHYDIWAYEEYLSSATGSELADTAIELRLSLGDPEALGHSLLVASRIAWVQSRRADAITFAEEAVDVLEEVSGEPLALAYSTLSQLAMLGNEEEKTIRFAEMALSIVGDADSQAKAHALNNLGAVKMSGHYPDGVSELEQSYRMSAKLGLSHDQARACVNLAWNYLIVRELESALFWIERGMEIMNEAEMPAFESYAVMEKAMWHDLRGDWEIAAETCRAVLERSAVQAASLASATMILAKVMVRRGEAEAATLVFDSMELAESADEVQRLGPAASVLVEYHWQGGEVPDELLARAVEIRDLCYQLGTPWLGADLGQWLRIAGVVEDVIAVAPKPYRLLTEGDWEGAARIWREKQAPYDLALALSSGDVDARLEALGIFDQLGAVPSAARLRTELQAEGVKGVPRGPQRATRDNPLGLTARQADVLTLLTEDLTNAEIADRLFISTRTVDHHVSAILMRLGAANRSEAAAKARDALSAAR